MTQRSAQVSRTTAETDITVEWDLDTAAPADIETGIGFLDHMLDALGKHSGTFLKVRCKGDLHIDGHHTTEDIGIVMGQCFRKALLSQDVSAAGIERFAFIQVPLDEALIAASLDISGRGYLGYGLQIPAPQIGSWDTELVSEFFGAFAHNAKVCLHLEQRNGVNSHHIVEAAFKATARVIRQAIAITGNSVPSTKGSL